MHTLNLGILAHVDAGKTSLTERLLHAAGVIDEVGSVDHGNTQTDSMALERQRGITIKSAVVSFVIDDVTVNLIDTPGHPDFIAEVERVLSVLDGAVLVISAVEGVQAQTLVLMRALQRLRIPTLIFVNKIDRSGAQYDARLRDLAARLAPDLIAMGVAHSLGARDAAFVPFEEGNGAFAAGLRNLLAERNDTLLADFVADEMSVSYRRLRRELAAQTGQARVHPVFFGSAITGAGVAALTSAIAELLPATVGDADAPVSGSVFKVERGPAGEKIAYVRMFAGTVRVREVVGAGRVTGISVFERGAVVPRTAVTAGQIGTLTGLGDIRIGDPIGVPAKPSAPEHFFAPPTLETVVVPRYPAEKGALHLALAQLAEQDPLINLRQDDVRQEIFVSLYGEVQKEVIEATLAADFGLAVSFRETTTICVERPDGDGAAAEFVGLEPNPFWATVGLRVGPAPAGSGVTFRLAVELGSMPLAYFTAVEEAVRETLRQGLYGWEVPDCLVTVTHAGFAPPLSTAGDFRNLTPLVLMAALRRAGTTVHEPIQRFHLDIPADSLGAVLQVLAPLHAVADTTVPRDSTYELEGDIPAARAHDLQQRLPALTHGEGVLDCAFDHYRPVRGTPPVRPRSDNNPLHRRDYLLRVVRRTTAGDRP